MAMTVDIMQKELQWSKTQKEIEIKRAEDFLGSFGGPRPMKREDDEKQQCEE